MPDARLSVILPTDTYATIRPVIERLRRQTVCREIEVVLIAPSAEAMSPVLAHRDEFAALKIVESPTDDLASARAVGIHAATAPAVFVGESHSYPQPGWAEALLGALAGPWAAVSPAFGNANVHGALSWAAFLSDYGRWAQGLPSGEITEVPINNAAYHRSVLLELGDRLPHALTYGDELPVGMRARGQRCYLEAEARIDHVNVAIPSHWIRERYISGLLIASHRARRWSLARRLLYVAGSGLIPVVLLRRTFPAVRQTLRHTPLPAGTIPAIVFGMIVKAAGELVGYAGGSIVKADRQMYEYEMHKAAYVGRGQR